MSDYKAMERAYVRAKADAEAAEQRIDELEAALAGARDRLASLYVEIDRQTHDDNLQQGFDAPDDFEHCVMLTARMIRQFNAAFEAMDRAAFARAPDTPPKEKAAP